VSVAATATSQANLDVDPFQPGQLFARYST
jgi:hypothetical protein